MIFRLTHWRPGFTGYTAGVDFVNGHGSTSSVQDVLRLVRLGCRIADPEEQAGIRTAARALGRAKAKAEAERRRLDAWERDPANTKAILKRNEELAEKHKPKERRRPRRII